MVTYSQIDSLSADELFAIERKSVGPGWQPIIEELHNALKAACPDYKPIQIKEKFGDLRFYVKGVPYPSNAHSLIDAAEEKSRSTCEECGGVGEVQSVLGWFRCLCGKCFPIQKAAQEARRKSLS